jgi:hypothetical protein
MNYDVDSVQFRSISMRLTQRKVILFGGLLLGIAIICAYFLVNNNSIRIPFLGINSTLPQQNSSNSSSPGASGSGTATNSGYLGTLMGSKQTAGQPGKALALLEEWLAAIARNDKENQAALIQSMIETLHANPEGNPAFYQRIRQLLNDSFFDAANKQSLVWILDRAATASAIKLLAEWYHLISLRNSKNPSIGQLQT